MNTMEEYAKFVVMAEDAIVTQNTAKMRWLGLESRRQTIQHDMIFLESAIKTSRKNPAYKSMCSDYEDSIRSNLKKMKDVIVELRLDHCLNEQLRQIERMTKIKVLHAFMDEELYLYYCSGQPMENLTFPVKKTLHDKLKIALDESV
jgi:hypothetical protein